ncbi:hypothetical protein [Flavobacterium sp. LM4]|uniref:hypothetical protein n=1 Tax=Flavobacterium sp. LM4 TaxID=1938609 RepID=UPI0009944E04|nr:hypothetical protein [Flavobacterium sp. LM4]OOV20257.1 hypothetical protein BXU10_11775 [Flavobacterium sp. LM4]
MENRKIYFIDVIYYNCYSFYRRYEKDLNEFSGQALTAVCLSLNAIAILLLLQENFKIFLFENKWYTLFVSLPIILFTVIRYNKHINIEEIEDAIYTKEQHEIKRLNLIAGIYVFLSIFGTIVFAIVLGELNNPPPLWEKWFN